MTLARRPVPIPLGGGVDEATSDVLFEAPLVRELINGRIPKTGSIGKRFGEDALPASLPSTATYGEHNAIAEHEGRAVVLTQLGAYMHDAARAAWTSAGAVQPRPTQAKVDRLIRQNNSSVEPEIALVTVSSRTVACIAWHDPELQEGFYAWAEVPSDGGPLKVLSGPTKFGGSRRMTFAVRLAVAGTTVYAIAGSNDAPSDIFCSKCDAASTYTFSNPSTVSPGWGAGAMPVALLSNNSDSLWAVLDEGGTNYSIRRLTTSFVESASQLVGTRRALDAIRYGSTIVVVCSNGSIDDCAETLAGAPTNHPLVTVDVAVGPLYSASDRATISEAGSGTFFVAWEKTGSATAMFNQGLVIASVSAAYGLVAQGVVGTVRLAGRAAYADGVPLVPVLDSVLESTFRMGYIARPVTDAASAYTLTEAARFGQDLTNRQAVSRTVTVGGTATAHRTCIVPSILFDSVSKQWLLPYQMVSDATVTFQLGSKYGIDLLRLRISDAPALRSVSAQSLRTFGGGCGATYTDGVVHAEMTPAPIGLIDAPSYLDDDSSVSYEGILPEATSYFALAVRWRDERGNLHRGAPIYTVGFCPWDNDAGLPVNDRARRVRFPRPFPATIRGEKGGQSYEVEVYASNASGGPYHLHDVVTPEPHPTHLGVDFILISRVDSGTPTHIIATSEETDGIDYIARVGDVAVPADSWIDRWTESGELVHVPPPAVLDLCSTQQRVWLLSAENGRLDVFPSKLLADGYAPEFPTALRVRVPDEGGEATAIAALGDRILVFKERLLYAVFGDPGDNTGAGGSVTVRLLSSDVGCKEAQSVVEGPFGVVFRSATGGFHMISPSEQVTRLPALEDSLGDYQILSGTLVADRKEVRWAIATGSKAGKTLVFDYKAGAWLTHELGSATVHACTVGGVHTRVAYQGSVYAERDTWSTTLDSHSLKLTSAWLKLSGSELPLLNGFKRIWKTIVMGRWYSGDLIVRVAYDYGTTWTDVRTWTVADLTALAAADGLVHLEVQHTRQKCEAVRFQLEESNPGGQTPPPRGQGFTVLGATLECGVKRGSYARALPAASRK